jgi:hypothetical protein
MSFFTIYILPFFYLLLLSFLLQRNKFLLQNGFSKTFIILFFIAKCLAGVINDHTSLQYNGDVGLYFNDGLILYQTFLKDPAAFSKMVGQMFSISDFSLLNSHSSFIRTVFEGIKFIHFIADILSFGNVYTNTILFNGIASLVILRCWVFLKHYSSGWAAGAILFLMPSAFFFTSNILKEGLCFMLMAAILPLTYSLFQNIHFKKKLLLVVCYLLLFFFKFIIAITFAIALIGWGLIEKYPNKKSIITGGILVLCLLVFFGTKYLNPSLDFPSLLLQRQQEFMNLPAHSQIEVPTPAPSFPGFISVLPSIINNMLFKPLPGEGGKALYLVFSIEIFTFWSIAIFLFVKNRLRFSFTKVRPLFWAHAFYAMANLLIIGLIVPNIGAMVRYRSIFLPWLALFLWYLFNGDKWVAGLSSNGSRNSR